MKKFVKLLVACFACSFLLNSCANMAEDSYEESSSYEKSPSINEARKSRICSITYYSDYGIIPKQIKNEQLYSLTEKEILPLYENKKTFEGWVDDQGQKIDMEYKLADNMQFTAKWRDISIGDIVLAEGPVVSPDYYCIIQKAVHPMAIIYNTKDKILGVSTITKDLHWEGFEPNYLSSIESGVHTYELMKENISYFNDKNSPIFSFAKNYSQNFPEVPESPYKDGWYIPAKKEIRTMFFKMPEINLSFSKINKDKILIEECKNAKPVWCCTADNKRIIGICLVPTGYYSYTRFEIERKIKNWVCYEDYTEEKVEINNKDYRFFYIKYNSSYDLKTYCIREF